MWDHPTPRDAAEHPPGAAPLCPDPIPGSSRVGKACRKKRFDGIETLIRVCKVCSVLLVFSKAKGRRVLPSRWGAEQELGTLGCSSRGGSAPGQSLDCFEIREKGPPCWAPQPCGSRDLVLEVGQLQEAAGFQLRACGTEFLGLGHISALDIREHKFVAVLNRVIKVGLLRPPRGPLGEGVIYVNAEKCIYNLK